MSHWNPTSRQWMRQLKRSRIGYLPLAFGGNPEEQELDTRETQFYCLRLKSASNFRIPSFVHEMLRQDPDIFIRFHLQISFVDLNSRCFFGKTVSTSANGPVDNIQDSSISRRVDWDETIYYKSKQVGAIERGIVELVLNIYRPSEASKLTGGESKVLVDCMSLGWTTIRIFGSDIPSLSLKHEEDSSIEVQKEPFLQGTPQAILLNRPDFNSDEDVQDNVTKLIQRFKEVRGSYLEYSVYVCPPLSRLRHLFRHNEPLLSHENIPGLGKLMFPREPQRLRDMELDAMTAMIRISNPCLRVSDTFEQTLTKRLSCLRRNRWSALPEIATIRQRALRIGLHNGRRYVTAPQRISLEYINGDLHPDRVKKLEPGLEKSIIDDSDFYFSSGAVEISTCCDLEDDKLALIFQLEVTMDWASAKTGEKLSIETYIVGWTLGTLGREHPNKLHLDGIVRNLQLHNAPKMAPGGSPCFSVRNDSGYPTQIWLSVGMASPSRDKTDGKKSEVDTKSRPTSHHRMNHQQLQQLQPSQQPTRDKADGKKWEVDTKSINHQQQQQPMSREVLMKQMDDDEEEKNKKRPTSSGNLIPMEATLDSSVEYYDDYYPNSDNSNSDMIKASFVDDHPVRLDIERRDTEQARGTNVNFHLTDFSPSIAKGDRKQPLNARRNEVELTVYFYGKKSVVSIGQSSSSVTRFNIEAEEWWKFVAYLYHGSATINVRDTKSLMPLGSVTIPLRALLLQGRTSTSLEMALPVFLERVCSPFKRYKDGMEVGIGGGRRRRKSKAADPAAADDILRSERIRTGTLKLRLEHLLRPQALMGGGEKGSPCWIPGMMERYLRIEGDNIFDPHARLLLNGKKKKRVTAVDVDDWCSPEGMISHRSRGGGKRSRVSGDTKKRQRLRTIRRNPILEANVGTTTSSSIESYQRRIITAKVERSRKRADFLRSIKADSTTHCKIAPQRGECVYFEAAFSNPFDRKARFSVAIRDKKQGRRGEQKKPKAGSNDDDLKKQLVATSTSPSSQHSGDGRAPFKVSTMKDGGMSWKDRSSSSAEALSIVVEPEERRRLQEAFGYNQQPGPEIDINGNLVLEKREEAVLGFRFQQYSEIQKSKIIVKVAYERRRLCRLVVHVHPHQTPIKKVYEMHNLGSQKVRSYPIPILDAKTSPPFASRKREGGESPPAYKSPHLLLEWQMSMPPRSVVSSSQMLYASFTSSSSSSSSGQRRKGRRRKEGGGEGQVSVRDGGGGDYDYEKEKSDEEIEAELNGLRLFITSRFPKTSEGAASALVFVYGDSDNIYLLETYKIVFVPHQLRALTLRPGFTHKDSILLENAKPGMQLVFPGTSTTENLIRMTSQRMSNSKVEYGVVAPQPGLFSLVAHLTAADDDAPGRVRMATSWIYRIKSEYPKPSRNFELTLVHGFSVTKSFQYANASEARVLRFHVDNDRVLTFTSSIVEYDDDASTKEVEVQLKGSLTRKEEKRCNDQKLDSFRKQAYIYVTAADGNAILDCIKFKLNITMK